MQDNSSVISEIEYEKFVLDQLAPMDTEAQKEHVIASAEEEFLEVENVELRYKILERELLIWQRIKPVVKFLRQYKRKPTEADLKDFMTVTVVKRTLDNGAKVEKTFDDHIAALQSEKKELLEKELINELGDLLFFVVAAGSEKINCNLASIIVEAQKKLSYYVAVIKTTTYEALRMANFMKLAGGENARYTNGYNVKQDLLRK